MPGGFPILDEVCAGVNVGVNTATSQGAALTASTTNNTKGSWTQLTASSASDCCFIVIDALLDANGFGGSEYTGSIDIGVGGAGAEVVVIQDLVLAPCYLQPTGWRISLPFSIPAGTRIAARCQTSQSSNVGARTIYLQVLLYDGSFTMEGASGVDALGFVSGSTFGTAITPNATADTYGSYSQLIASTSRDYIGLFGMIDFQNNGTNANYILFNIAIGGGGSEVDIIPALSYNADGSSFSGSAIPFIPIKIPAGTRLSAKCQASVTSSNPIGLTLYGVY